LTGEVDDLLLLFREDELAVPTYLYSMSRQPPVPPSLEKGVISGHAHFKVSEAGVAQPLLA